MAKGPAKARSVAHVLRLLPTLRSNGETGPLWCCTDEEAAGCGEERVC